MVYVYDLGSEWIHDITLEAVEKGGVEHAMWLAGKEKLPSDWDDVSPMEYEGRIRGETRKMVK